MNGIRRKYQEESRKQARDSALRMEKEEGRLTRDGTTKHVSGDQILRRVLAQGNINFPFSADPEQDWQQP